MITAVGFQEPEPDLDADPERAARHFVMLRDGAMAAGCLTDPKPICETFLFGIDGLLSRSSTA